MIKIRNYVMLGLLAATLAVGVGQLFPDHEVRAVNNSWSGTALWDFNVDSTSFNTDTTSVVGVFTGLADKQRLTGLLSIAYRSLDTGTAGPTDFLDTTKDTVWALVEAANAGTSTWWTVSKIKYTAFKVDASRTYSQFAVSADSVLGDKVRFRFITSTSDSDVTVGRNMGGATFDAQVWLWAK